MSTEIWTTVAIATSAVATGAAAGALGRLPRGGLQDSGRATGTRSPSLRALTVVLIAGLAGLAGLASSAGTSANVAGSAGGPGSVAAHLSSTPPGPAHLGSASSKPIVGMAATPGGRGYWQVAADGGVFTFGDATFYGSTGNIRLNQPIMDMAATPDGRGYWLVASDGGIFSFGDATFHGSTGNIHLNRPIVGMASTADGRGYWLVASDGGIFSFGDATFHGSTGNIHLNRPIVGMAATPDGGGYWLAASDGGIFNFGDATFHGSTGNVHLNRPIVGMAATPDGGGYWLVASDGGIFNFGDATFCGSMGGTVLNAPMVTMTTSTSGGGYWTVAADGGIFNFGGAPFLGSLVTPAPPSHGVLGDPPANIPPNPNFLTSTCYPHTTGAACTALVLQATSGARAAEGLGPMSLPGNFNVLTPDEQLFVLTNIERVDRGLPPLVGLVATFSADAQAGAQGLTDPTPAGVPAGLHVVAWASNWAENVNPLGSNYFWMYDDGLNSGNIDCTASDQTGCWGHRQNILSLTNYQIQYGGTLLMGAAESTGNTGNGYESDAELLVLATGPVPALSYTWAQAVAAGAG